MEIDAFLCDHAVVAEGKLYVNGGAFNMFAVAPVAPHIVSFYIAAVVTVPYTATNQAHTLSADLVTEDGQPVHPMVPDGVPDPGPVRVAAEFNVGRPPALQVGQAQNIPVAFAIQNLPLPRLGGYSMVLKLEDTEMKRLEFRLVAPPQQMGYGGPSSIPPFLQ